MLLSASETWADLVGYPAKDARIVNFVVESGSLELIIIGTKSGPKRLSHKLATVTGFQAMPPIFAVGFHYSKWEKETSTNQVMDYNRRFEEFGYPADVFWLDISHTQDSKYFAFDKKKFSNKAIKLMNDVIDYSEKRLVVITDPHIKQDKSFEVYSNGVEL